MPVFTGEERSFGLEQPVERPAIIPDDVLKILRQNSDISTCPVSEELRNTIPASWYEASEVHLNGASQGDLIVKAKNACFWGPNLGPFWIFKGTAHHGHRLVLSTVAVGLDVLTTQTKGLHDIRMFAFVSLEPSYVRYKFDGNEYQAVSHDQRRLADK